MNTRLFLLLALCVGLCWGCVSAPKKPSPEPEFAMETFLPPPILDLGPKTHSGFEPVNESKEPNTKASILPPPQESVHFEFNQSKPNDREWDVLKNHGEYLLQNPNVRAKHGHGPFCDDAPLCGDRLLRALCALRDGDGLQPRGAWPHGDGDRAWTWGVLQLNSATLLRSNHECQI